MPTNYPQYTKTMVNIPSPKIILIPTLRCLPFVKARVEVGSNPGFTIVEIIVTVVVLGLLVPALVSMITVLGDINDRARDMSIIHALAENKVEALRSINFTGLTNGTTDFTTELPATISEPRSATYTISSVNASLKQVDVTVSYNEHSQTRTLQYRTYVGELGVGQY